jgi:hypothetical protein
MRAPRHLHRLGPRDPPGQPEPDLRQRPFLIHPDVAVPNLASWLLSAITRRLPGDWRARYGYAPILAETFAETPRFTGASYRAANWTRVGHTQGRGKLDRHHDHALPIKDIYLYPLHRRWRQILTTPPTQ